MEKVNVKAREEILIFLRLSKSSQLLTYDNHITLQADFELNKKDVGNEIEEEVTCKGLEGNKYC